MPGQPRSAHQIDVIPGFFAWQGTWNPGVTFGLAPRQRPSVQYDGERETGHESSDVSAVRDAARATAGENPREQVVHDDVEAQDEARRQLEHPAER